MSQLFASQPDKKYAPRRAADYYPTPQPVVRSCLRTLNERGGLINVLRGSAIRIHDAGADSGIWGVEAADLCADLRGTHEGIALCGSEIRREVPRPDRYDDWYEGDYLTHTGRYNLIVGNPPFSLALQFVQHSLALLDGDGICAFLLPLNFLSSQSRLPLFTSGHLRRVVVLSSRPSFVKNKHGKDGTNASEYAFYVFSAAASSEPPTLSWLNWKKHS